ncbi:MAG: maleylpyruvate isomerase family mycothiol-dependent enzyme [Marmoricola sp.]
MTELLDRSIKSLRFEQDRLEALVARITPEQLSGPSCAAEWTVAQVLSHLGSGAEITRATLATALDETAAATPDNQAVWDRWDAASPADQASWSVEHGERLVTLLEQLDAEQRETTLVDLGFLPEPVPLEVAVGMRLNEVTAHSWDARVGVDPQATLDAQGADLVLEHYAGGLGFLLGFAGKADQLEGAAQVALDGYYVSIDETVTVSAGVPDAPTATFTGPLEAAVRLLSGRLTPERTPAGVEVTGNVSLEDLRKVFPGY